jgi:uncharacterized protein YbjQ (UPF0145 family)
MSGAVLLTRRAGMLLAASLTLWACTSQQSFTPIITAEARPVDHPIDVFQGDAVPSRPYTEVAMLDVHLEATHFITYSFDDALPKLEEQTRAAGGDAIIAIKETRGRHLETSMYHITAKAVRYGG